MRISSFLLGGLVGAGAMIYWNRKGRQEALTAVSNQAGNMINRMMNTGSKMERSVEKAASKVKNQDDSAFGLDKVEEIVNKDPELKRNVDEIIHSQNHSSHKETPVMTQ